MSVPLRNAAYSSTFVLYSCGEFQCTADKAHDGNMSTYSVTTSDTDVQWWEGELTKRSMISRILVYTTKYALDKGKFQRFKVETRMSRWTKWNVCKGEHSMQAYDPHVVICDQPTNAKYLRLSIAGGSNLYLTEVQVEETVGKNLIPMSVCQNGVMIFCLYRH